MLFDLTCAGLCYKTYFEPGAFDQIIDSNGVYAGIKQYADCTAIAFRGSTTITDWHRDFEAEMIDDPQLGQVEAGFLTGLREAFASPNGHFSTEKLIITGHSLGAARALLFSALIIAGKGNYIPKVVTFGSPRPGAQKLKDILANTPICSYKNGDDPVTDVPFNLPEFPYIHPRELIPVKVESVTPDPWFVLHNHHIQNYIAALALKDI